MQEENNFKLNYWLSPFALLYGLVVRIRNFMFDKKILSSKSYPIPVICVGNLAAGGTGKTPHIEYIIRLLRDKYKVAVLSRGYKRHTKGYHLANDKSTSVTIGDEPFQIKQKFPEILVAVDEDRRRGIERLLSLEELVRPEVILLDDGFQHRYVSPSLSIVLTDYNRLYYNDSLLPTGQLREPKNGILRADAVIVSKCAPDLKPIDFRIMEENMNLWAHQMVYFTMIRYQHVKPVFPEEAFFIPNTALKGYEIVAVAGIAKPELFLNIIQSLSENITPILFSDHHDFGKKDIKKIQEALNRINTENKIILTTEKDAARLVCNKYIPGEWRKLLYYIPIEIEFCSKNYASFDEVILKHVRDFKKNRI